MFNSKESVVQEQIPEDQMQRIKVNIKRLSDEICKNSKSRDLADFEDLFFYEITLPLKLIKNFGSIGEAAAASFSIFYLILKEVLSEDDLRIVLNKENASKIFFYSDKYTYFNKNIDFISILNSSGFDGLSYAKNLISSLILLHVDSHLSGNEVE